MGLFGKKEVCPVCGNKIKGDVLIKIKDNMPLCRDCSAAINMDTMMIPYQTPEAIRAHLQYRDVNQDKFDVFEVDQDIKAGSAIFCVDEKRRYWYCTTNKRDKNPPVFTFDEIADYQYTENGEPYVPEEKKGVLSALFGEKKEPVMIGSMKLHIDLNNPYTHTIDIEMLSMDEQIKSNSLAYKSNKRAIDRIIEALDFMTGRETVYTSDENIPMEDAADLNGSEQNTEDIYIPQDTYDPSYEQQEASVQDAADSAQEYSEEPAVVETQEPWEAQDTAPVLSFGEEPVDGADADPEEEI